MLPFCLLRLTVTRCVDDVLLRVKEKLRNGELTVAGDQWPVFLYHGYNYNQDDPWNGLFRSSLLVTVSHFQI